MAIKAFINTLKACNTKQLERKRMKYPQGSNYVLREQLEDDLHLAFRTLERITKGERVYIDVNPEN